MAIQVCTYWSITAVKGSAGSYPLDREIDPGDLVGQDGDQQVILAAEDGVDGAGRQAGRVGDGLKPDPCTLAADQGARRVEQRTPVGLLSPPPVAPVFPSAAVDSFDSPRRSRNLIIVVIELRNWQAADPADPLDQALRLADGRVLGYAEYGPAAGPPLFLFHGLPGSRLAVPEMWPEDPGQVRVIAPDRPGLGSSTFQPGRRLTDWAMMSGSWPIRWALSDSWSRDSLAAARMPWRWPTACLTG